MFELKCFIDDKKLAQVLRLLDGLVYEPHCVPVREAATNKGKVVSTNGSGVETVLAHLPKSGEFNADDLRMACQNAGMSAGSYSYFVQKLVAAKAIKRLPKKGQYKLVGGK